MRRPPDGIGGAPADRQHGIAQGVVDLHERAVVLPEEHVSRDPALGKRPAKAIGHRAQRLHQRRVQNARILALEQPDRSDLGRERHRNIELFRHDVGCPLLLRCVDRREHADDSDCVHAAAHLSARSSNLVLVDVCDRVPVDFEPARDDRRLRADRAFQVVWPAFEGWHRRGCWSCESHDADASETATLENRIGRVRGSDHCEADARWVDLRSLQHLVDRGENAVAGLLGRRRLHGGDDFERRIVEDYRVGVRSADVDAQPVFGQEELLSVVAGNPCAARDSTGCQSTSNPKYRGPAVSMPMSVRQRSSAGMPTTEMRWP